SASELENLGQNEQRVSMAVQGVRSCSQVQGRSGQSFRLFESAFPGENPCLHGLPGQCSIEVVVPGGFARHPDPLRRLVITILLVKRNSKLGGTRGQHSDVL